MAYHPDKREQLMILPQSIENYVGPICAFDAVVALDSDKCGIITNPASREGSTHSLKDKQKYH